MKPTIMISKIDDQYLITSEFEVYIRTKWEDASKLVGDLLDPPKPKDCGWPNSADWIKEILKDPEQ